MVLKRRLNPLALIRGVEILSAEEEFVLLLDVEEGKLLLDAEDFVLLVNAEEEEE